MMDRKILSDAEVEALFETHNISDIKQLHSELERDIDKKREELRTTVGERYRDLMEAAETITRMKTTSNDVVNAFKNIAETTAKFDYYPTTATQHHIRETEQETKKDINPEKKENLNESDLAVAAEIKLLMDSPEMIWSAVDNGDYLTAAQVFLFARHIHTNLTFQSNAVCHLFPIIERQWSSILPFYDTILSGCLQLMSDGSHIFGAETYDEGNLLEELNTTKVIRAMATIILLKGISMKDLFMEFLGLRETSIKKKIFAEEHSAKVHIRNTIISVVSCIKSCVAFCSTGNTKDNIESILNDIAEKPAIRLYQNVSVSPVMKYLPSIIKDFCPSVVVKKDPLAAPRSNEDSILTEEYLQLECTNWLDRVHDMISEGTAKVLSHVNTLGGISIIRRGVYDFLSYSESKDNSTSLVEDWKSVCLFTIKRNVNIWDEFYRNLFRDRVEELITKEIEKAVQYLQEKIDSSSSQSSEIETAEFIWSEPNISDARIDRTSEKDQAVKTFTALELKARSYSPSVQAICEKFDAMLQALMYDLGAYVKSDKEDENISPTKFSRENYSFLVDESSNDECRSNIPFLLEQDHNAILQFVEDSTLKTVSEMLQSITLKVKEEIKPDCNSRSDCYVFRARICQAVPELCPSLESCASASSKLQKTNVLEAFPGNDYLGELKHLSHKTVKTKHENNAKLRKVYEHFFETCTFLLISWVNSLGIVLKNEIKLFLSNNKEANLSLLPQWEEIEIAEENEEGKQIKSTIRVPNQISVGLYQALCQHANAIYSIGSHNLPSQVQDAITRNSSSWAAHVYQQWFNQDQLKLTQNVALQLYFDVQFILQCMTSRENKDASSVGQAALNSIERHIDPFDLSVFSNYITTNVKRCVLKYQALFGILIPMDRYTLLTSMKATLPQPASSIQLSNVGASQPSECAVQLSSCTQRFPLLPVATKKSETARHGSRSVNRKYVMGPNTASTQDVTTINDDRVSLKDERLGNSHQESSPKTRKRDKSPVNKAWSAFEEMSNKWFGTGK